jgi:hypothetical protein
MQIWVNIQLAEGDVMQETSAEIADGVLRAVGGDETKDFCSVTISHPLPTPGSVGTPPPAES